MMGSGVVRVLVLLSFLCASAGAQNVTEAEDLSCAAARSAKTYEEQCEIAKSEDCDSAYAAAYYCAKSVGSRSVLILVYLCWLVLLFSLLGTTADEYFSPALEQLSTDFGLPPRFAGVTLLALGNGAPDVSSTIHAVSSDRHGYRLALGALTGAGMFVGTVVAGAVMVVAGGAKAKGALMRDVSAYLSCCLLLVFLIGSVGTMSFAGVTLLLVCYATFVSIVLAADLWHRRPGGPAERQARLAAIQANQPGGAGNDDEEDETPAIELLMTLIHSVKRPDYHHGEHHHHHAVHSSHEIEDGVSGLPSRRVNNDDDDELALQQQLPSGLPAVPPTPGQNNYVVIDGDQPMEMGGSSDFTTGLLGAASGGAASDEVSGGLRGANTRGGNNDDDNDSDISKGNEPFVYDGNQYVGLFVEMYERSVDHTKACFGLPPHQLVVSVGELPFVLARRMTVPLTCDDAYARGPLVGSCVFAPLWLTYYASQRGAGSSVAAYVIMGLLGACVAVAVAQATDKGKTLPGTPALFLSLFGFAVAATWIDVLADQLVSLLQFVGNLVAIPETALGLTVLAWGNSIGDFSTNIAMAKKGLANMSMTACFAGPLFNALMGLGLGFAFRLSSDEVDGASVNVSLDPALYVGFAFLIINCVNVLAVGIFNKGRLPKQFGFVSIALYLCYVTISLSILL